MLPNDDGRCTLLEHASDVGLQATGPDRRVALAAASRGLTGLMVDPATVEERVERRLRAEGFDEAAQIVAWLNEVLFLFDTEGLLLSRFEITRWDDTTVEGEAAGEPFDPPRHELRTGVKAATYHQLASGPDGRGGWEIRVFLDL